MDLTPPDLTPLTAPVAEGAADLPGSDESFAPAMQSVAVLAEAVAAPVAYHPGLYAGGFLLALFVASYTLWRVRQGEQAQGR